MGVYRPKFVPQWNDPTTTLDWFNCTMAAGAMALDFDTLGAVQKRGGELRAVSGDSSGGTGLGDPGLTRAWEHYGETLHVQTGQGWFSVLSALDSYKAVVLQGMYGALPKKYHSPLNSFDFTGPHAIVVLPEITYILGVKHRLMGDPLNDKYIWVPEAALKSFAEALGMHENGHTGYLFFASSDAHKPSDPQYRMYIAEGTTVMYYATLILGRVAKWNKVPWSGKASSAPCQAPVPRKSLAGGASDTVLVTDGTFKGKNVKLGYGVTASRS